MGTPDPNKYHHHLLEAFRIIVMGAPEGALVAITIKARVKAATRRVVDTVQIVDTTIKEEVVPTNNVAVDPIKIKEEVTTITRGKTRTTEMITTTGITNKIGIIIIDQVVPADFLLKEAHAVMVITADLCMISNLLVKKPNIAGFSTKILYQLQLDNEKKSFFFAQCSCLLFDMFIYL